jgi:hypothetical protein
MTTAPAQQGPTAPVDNRDHQPHRHPLDDLIPDPTGLTPMGDEQEFTAILEKMVADAVPRLFAVVQEYGERVDGRIVGWGIAFSDRAEVAAVERGLRVSVSAPEHALHLFKCGSHIRARLVWVNPDAATQ